MLRSRISQAAVAASTLVLGAGLMGATSPAADAAPDRSDQVPTFRQYERSVPKDEVGQYIVNGDEVIGSKADLRRYYTLMTNPNVGTVEHQNLAVNTVGGSWDVWSASQVGNLTYCVSTDFGADYNGVVNAMAQGAANWENASSAIDFVHVSSADSDCTTSTSSVLFSVEPTTDTSFIARAFFPSSADYERNVLVNPDSLFSSGSWTPGNILGHELGHTLGFRHEHTRPEAGTCFEDNNWDPLTAYDSSSIMHYPQCNGSSSDLSFTASDGEGTRVAYGS